MNNIEELLSLVRGLSQLAESKLEDSVREDLILDGSQKRRLDRIFKDLKVEPYVETENSADRLLDFFSWLDKVCALLAQQEEHADTFLAIAKAELEEAKAKANLAGKEVSKAAAHYHSLEEAKYKREMPHEYGYLIDLPVSPTGKCLYLLFNEFNQKLKSDFGKGIETGGYLSHSHQLGIILKVHHSNIDNILRAIRLLTPIYQADSDGCVPFNVLSSFKSYATLRVKQDLSEASITDGFGDSIEYLGPLEKALDYLSIDYIYMFRDNE